VICDRTDKQTDIQTHSDHNTSQPYRGEKIYYPQRFSFDGPDDLVQCKEIEIIKAGWAENDSSSGGHSRCQLMSDRK